MNYMFSSTLGTIFYTALVFLCGMWVGKPMFTWVTAKLPWNK